MSTIDSVTLAHVTGGNLSRPPQLPRPQLPPSTGPRPQPKPLEIPGFNPKYPPGSLDLPRRNDLA
jgi:hypothetical protein